MSSGNYSSCITVPAPLPPSIEFQLNAKSKECRYNQRFYCKSPKSYECEWAYKIEDVQKACCLAHVCLTTKPKFCRFKENIQASIQNGPTCGLTALYMLTGGSPTTDDILVLAKRKRYTNHGEMFCARHLKELGENVFDSIGYRVQMELYLGELNCDYIKTELKNGACILVAYPFQ